MIPTLIDDVRGAVADQNAEVQQTWRTVVLAVFEGSLEDPQHLALILGDLRKTPEDLAADVDRLTKLRGLAELARTIPDRRERREAASTAFAAAKLKAEQLRVEAKEVERRAYRAHVAAQDAETAATSAFSELRRLIGGPLIATWLAANAKRVKAQTNLSQASQTLAYHNANAHVPAVSGEPSHVDSANARAARLPALEAELAEAEAELAEAERAILAEGAQ